jgi:hypothetical protein
VLPQVQVQVHVHVWVQAQVQAQVQALALTTARILSFTLRGFRVVCCLASRGMCPIARARFRVEISWVLHQSRLHRWGHFVAMNRVTSAGLIRSV